jgi:two-component system, OmpR family, response regulator QseB
MYILIVEDDAMLREILGRELRALGVAAETAGTLAEAQLGLANETFDAVVLDINLPDGSGLDLLTALREHDAMTPVLLLTTRDGLDDRVRGLDSGADDYLGKPFRIPELAARLRAIGRRRARGEMVIARGGIVLEPARLSASVDGRRIDLSPREAALLDTLMRWPGTIQSKRDLEARIYGWQDGIESNTIEVHVHNLRGKIGRHRIETVRGVGYRLRLGA